MKKFMKKLAKKAEGFTLVELVVVIAILGILAGVAVPAYSGYLEKANDAAAVNELSAIQTAAQSAAAMNGTSVESITITFTGTTGIAVVVEDTTVASDVTADFGELYTPSASLYTDLAKHSDLESTDTTVTWTNNAWSIPEA